MNERRVVGLNPWLPWPLCDWPWWTEPVRAERLAALRIGVALVLLCDVLLGYLPHAHDFFGHNSLGSPEVFVPPPGVWRWSLLRGVEDRLAISGALILWAVAAAFLLMGVLSRLSAVAAWMCSMSFMGINYYLHNSGDNVRNILLFYLMLCPCGAVWALRRREDQGTSQRAEPIYVPAWPVRLLFIQLMISYFVNGIYKATGPDWREGHIMHYVMSNLAWTRVSYAQLPLPEFVLQAMTWTTLLWELFFPVLVLLRRTRTLTLLIGIGFHLGTGIFLQLGPFPLYMMCLYLPIVPWESFVDRWHERRATARSLRAMPY